MAQAVAGPAILVLVGAVLLTRHLAAQPAVGSNMGAGIGALGAAGAYLAAALASAAVVTRRVALTVVAVVVLADRPPSSCSPSPARSKADDEGRRGHRRGSTTSAVTTDRSVQLGTDAA